MKYISQLFSVSIIVAMVGCGLLGETEGQPVEPEPETYFRALVNGEAWEGDEQQAGLMRTDYITLSSALHHENIFPYFEEIAVWVPWHEVGEYDISRQRHDSGPHEGQYAGAVYGEVDGDVNISWYRPTEGGEHRMAVTGYDPETGLMEGTFEVTFVIEEGQRDSPFRRQPDTLRFTDGEFRVVVEDHR